jgi:hypothetical protein
LRVETGQYPNIIIGEGGIIEFGAGGAFSANSRRMKRVRPPTEAALLLVVSPRLITANAFEHAQRTPCLYVQHFMHEPWQSAATGALFRRGPVAYRMAHIRGRSTYMWLDAAMIFAPLALLALLIFGKRRVSRTSRASN